jgi:hypothetical protein
MKISSTGGIEATKFWCLDCHSLYLEFCQKAKPRHKSINTIAMRRMLSTGHSIKGVWKNSAKTQVKRDGEYYAYVADQNYGFRLPNNYLGV